MLPTDKDILSFQLSPSEFKKYLGILDNRGESYHFNVSNPTKDPFITLLLQSEGGQTPLKIFLQNDGRWVAIYDIEV